jgi:hypothetical protein
MLHQLALPFLISALAFAICYLYWTTKPSTPLPPGPPAHPWIGHLLKLPAAYQEGIFHEWSKIYGDIRSLSPLSYSPDLPSCPGDVTYLHILGMPVIVLNTAQAAFDLLDERGFIYSDRPKFVMYVDL